MGFKLGRGIHLVFTGAMEGAEVHIKPTPISTLLELQKQTLPFDEAARLLAENVLNWNFDGLDDKPLEVSAEAILTNMEQPVLQKIIDEWRKAATGVSAPLDPPSKDGDDKSTDKEESTNLNDSSMAMIPQSPIYPQGN